MRLAVLSDIHGNYEALKKALIDMEKNRINTVIFLGDLVMKGPQPQETFDSLKKINPICWLKGNTDLWLSPVRTSCETNNSTSKEIESYRNFALKRLTQDSIKFILNCPTQKSLFFKNWDILCVHGSPRSIVETLIPNTDINTFEEILKYVEEDIILCGHSHIPFVKKIDKKIIFNPGSLGCPYDGKNDVSYGIININSSSISFCIRRINSVSYTHLTLPTKA